MTALAQFFALQHELRTLPGSPDLRAVYRQARNAGLDCTDAELVAYVDRVAFFRKCVCYSGGAAPDDAPEQMMRQLLQAEKMKAYAARAKQATDHRARARRVVAIPGFLLPSQLLPSPHEGELLASSPQNAD